MPALPGQAGTPSAGAPYAARFRAGDLRRVRRAVAEWTARAELRGRRAGDFVVAVHEIATNAVRHGSPTARLGLHIAGGTAVQAEVHDGEPDLHDVTIRRGASGSTVILRMRLPGQDARPRG